MKIKASGTWKPWILLRKYYKNFQFKSSEEKRVRNERTRQEQKHERQVAELTTKCEQNISELKQIQNEKRRLLVETEAEKLRSVDEGFKRKFEAWRAQLGPRKQVKAISRV